MPSTVVSKRAVFQTIADSSDFYWPYYHDPETEYTSSVLKAFEHDVHRLACEWFKHDADKDVEAFIGWCPLHHLDFSPHDAHPSWHAKTKPAVPMIRALMVMGLHRWEYETALVGYLDAQPDLVDALGFENIPTQSTISRARHE